MKPPSRRTKKSCDKHRLARIVLDRWVRYISGDNDTQRRTSGDNDTEKEIPIKHIQRHVADAYGIKLADLKSKKSAKAVAFPRQVAMYLARELTHVSLSEVGRAVGGKDHTTVLYAVDTIQVLLQKDRKLRNTIDRLTEAITL